MPGTNTLRSSSGVEKQKRADWRNCCASQEHWVFVALANTDFACRWSGSSSQLVDTQSNCIYWRSCSGLLCPRTSSSISVCLSCASLSSLGCPSANSWVPVRMPDSIVRVHCPRGSDNDSARPCAGWPLFACAPHRETSTDCRMHDVTNEQAASINATGARRWSPEWICERVASHRGSR